MIFFIELKEGLAIAWDAIRANKLRSWLTTLGIIIGVATVTLMGTAIDSLNDAFHQSISILGADTLYVNRIGWVFSSDVDWNKMKRRRSITWRQYREVEEDLSGVEGIAPRVETMQTVRYGNKSASSVYVLGTTDQYLVSADLRWARGGLFHRRNLEAAGRCA